MEAAAGLAYVPCSTPGMDAVQYTFSTAAENGFTVARVFGHGVNATLALQTSPGSTFVLIFLYVSTALVVLLLENHKLEISSKSILTF